jgi:hypothetical protein
MAAFADGRARTASRGGGIFTQGPAGRVTSSKQGTLATDVRGGTQMCVPSELLLTMSGASAGNCGPMAFKGACRWLRSSAETVAMQRSLVTLPRLTCGLSASLWAAGHSNRRSRNGVSRNASQMPEGGHQQHHSWVRSTVFGVANDGLRRSGCGEDVQIYSIIGLALLRPSYCCRSSRRMVPADHR